MQHIQSPYHGGNRTCSTYTLLCHGERDTCSTYTPPCHGERGTCSTYSPCTLVRERDMQHRQPVYHGGGGGGGGYPTIPPRRVGCIYSLSPSTLLSAPGYTSHTAGAPGVITAPTDAQARRHRAQTRRIPWVRAGLVPPGVISVSIPMGSVRGCSALPW